MNLNAFAVIGCAWAAVALVWLVSLVAIKPTVRTQPEGTRLFHLALLVLGGTLLGSQWFRYGWLATRFVPDTRGVQLAGAALTVAGCLFAIWARIILGANWSARATVKAGHELIVRGPYALARHPIYTGLLLAVAGTALAMGEWRCLLGAVVILFALLVKMSQEERLMIETFPQTYPEYRSRVKALVPGLF
jgi:protein-S-isoprenylcysteine O-methyltransferase Ste14